MKVLCSSCLIPSLYAGEIMQRFRASTNCESFDFRRGEDAPNSLHVVQIHSRRTPGSWLLLKSTEYTATSIDTCGTCIALVAGCTSYHSDGLEVRRNREVLARMIPGNIQRMQYDFHGKKSRVLLVGLLVRVGGSAEQ
jgi:hypothetical protein